MSKSLLVKRDSPWHPYEPRPETVREFVQAECESAFSDSGTLEGLEHTLDRLMEFVAVLLEAEIAQNPAIVEKLAKVSRAVSVALVETECKPK